MFNCNQINGLSYHAYRQTVGFRTLDQASAAVSHSVVTSLSTSRIGRQLNEEHQYSDFSAARLDISSKKISNLGRT